MQDLRHSRSITCGCHIHMPLSSAPTPAAARWNSSIHTKPDFRDNQNDSTSRIRPDACAYPHPAAFSASRDCHHRAGKSHPPVRGLPSAPVRLHCRRKRAPLPYTVPAFWALYEGPDRHSSGSVHSAYESPFLKVQYFLPAMHHLPAALNHVLRACPW